jgi:hypothetical protein
MPRGRPFPKGVSGNPAGRKPGIVDRRMRLNKALLADADALLAVAKAKAFEGDPQMLNLLLSRVIPTLRPEGERVQFDFDATQPLANQLEAVSKAVANGELTLEQGLRFVEIIEKLSAVRSAESGGSTDKDLALIGAFREMANNLDPRVR